MCRQLYQYFPPPRPPLPTKESISTFKPSEARAFDPSNPIAGGFGSSHSAQPAGSLPVTTKARQESASTKPSRAK